MFSNGANQRTLPALKFQADMGLLLSLSLAFTGAIHAQDTNPSTANEKPSEAAANSDAGENSNQTTCVKKVFNLYCLGGSELELPKSLHSGPMGEGPGKVLFYPEETVVVIFNGKIATVDRDLGDMTWLNYKTQLQKLQGLYGEGEDRSYYPSYAKAATSKETAIRIGKGKAVHRWKQDGWVVSLNWTKRGISLFYQHTALTEALLKASPGDGW